MSDILDTTITVNTCGVELRVDKRKLNDIRTLRIISRISKQAANADEQGVEFVVDLLDYFEWIFGKDGCDAVEASLREQSEDGYASAGDYSKALTEAFLQITSVKN